MKDLIGNKHILYRIILLACFIIFTPFSFKAFAQKPVLIEFGWDYPDINQVSNRIDSMQNTPFDGICISLQRTIMEAFDTVAKKGNYFEYKKLKSLKWGKYTDNYFILRGFSKTGGNWFDDKAWITISKNMASLSKAMLIGKMKGILFDPEYYYEDKLYNPWTYSKTQYPSKSFEEIQEQVRKRGSQFIIALQQYKTDLSFISIWLTSLIAEEKKYTPFEGTRHALLLSFIEGILLGKNKKVKIIDGNEYAYWNYKPSQFFEAADFLRKNTFDIMKTKRAKQSVANIEIAQPIFYDGLLAKTPSFELGLDNATKWKWMEENMKYAIATSGSITWFYSERLNWWQNKVNDTLINILQNSKTVFTSPVVAKKNKALKKEPANPNYNNVNEEKGYFYFANSKTPMKTGALAFTYKLNTNTKRLNISFAEKLPAEINVFANNRLSQAIKPINFTEILNLKNFSKGKLFILAKYNDTLEASAIQIYK